MSHFEDCLRNSGTNGHFNQGPTARKSFAFMEIRKRKEGGILYQEECDAKLPWRNADMAVLFKA
jgi:hypothetical protein